MGRLAAVVLSIFALSLASLALGWVTFKVANAARKQYRLWQDARNK